MMQCKIEHMAVAHGMAQASLSTFRSYLLPASRDISSSLRNAQASSKKEQRHLKEHALRGNDIADIVVSLCLMNLYLHGIGGDECPITANDALALKVGDDKVAYDKQS